MRAEQVTIAIDGVEAADIYPELSWVAVETGDDMAALFRFELRMAPRADGSWAYVDDERLTLWRRVEIGVGFEDGAEPVMTGYITHTLAVFEADPARCRLQVWGMDATVLLDRAEKLRAWPDMTDSDIVTAVLGEYGLDAAVTGTDVMHDERVSTVVQRESDAALLRRLAERNGFVCYADGDTVHFGPADPGAETLPTLAVHFGDETSVITFSVQVLGPGPAEVVVAQLDRTEKQVRTVRAATSESLPMGASTADAVLAPGVPAAVAYLAESPATGEAEMRVLGQAVFERDRWFVTAEAVVDGNRYGTVLRPGRTVLVKGAGDTHSGAYGITAVTHRVGLDGYQQHVRLRRDAVGLTGREAF